MIQVRAFPLENCELDHNSRITNQCAGSITVEDFIPRNFSFSFEFACYDMNYPTFALVVSLNGLVFNIIIYRLTDSVTCLPLTGDSICYQYYRYGGFPNLLGDKHSSLSDLFSNNFQCYQHAIQVGNG